MKNNIKKKDLFVMLLVILHCGIMIAQDNTFYMDDNSGVTIQSGATVHIEGDFHIDTGADLDNAGTIELQGDWRYESVSVDITLGPNNPEEQGLVVFQNNYPGNPHNVGNPQAIHALADMQFNGSFYDIDINNDADMVYLDGGSINVRNTLEFKDANDIFRTDATSHGTAGQDYAHTVLISNFDPTSIVGSSGTATGANGGYIEGKLELGVSDGNNYIFPIGVQKGTADNTEPFELNVATAPASAIVMGYIHNAPTSAVNTTTLYCDIADHQGSAGVEQFGTATPGADGKLDKITSDCQYSLAWRAETATLGAWDYTFTGHAGTNLQGECSFLTFGGTELSFLAKDGVPVTEGTALSSAPSPWTAGADPDGYQVCPAGSLSYTGTSFSEFRVGGSTATDEALPVELLSFAGRAEKEYNTLLWKTASEEQFSHFEIERSHDGISFEYIGTETARGTPALGASYEHRDRELQPLTYYRLKIVDKDASYEYSNIVSINRERETYVRIYPNPTNNWIKLNASVSSNTDVNIDILDALGREMASQKITSDSVGKLATDIDVSSFTSGSYILRIADGKNVMTRVLMKK